MRHLAYRFLLPIIVAAVLGLALPISRVMADEIITLDFTTSDHGCSVIPLVVGYNYGSYVPGTGFVASYADDSHTRWRVNCPTLIYENVYNITFQWNTSSLGNIVTLKAVNDSIVVSCWETSSCAGQHLTFVNSVSVGGGSYQYSYDFLGGDVDLSSLDMYEDWGFHNDAALQSIIIYTHNDCTEDCEPPLGDLTMPLKSDDQHPQWGMFDYQYVMDNDPENDGVLTSEFPDTVYAFSNKADAKVSAVAPGTVIDMKPYTGKDCDGAFVVLQSLRRCRIFIPSFITQETSQFVFNYELVNVWVIKVEDEDDPTVTYSYWLADPVVTVGDKVVAGCVLGKTIQLKNPTNNEISNFTVNVSGSLSESGDAGISVSGGVGGHFRSLLVDAGVTTVVAKEDGEPVQLYPRLTQEPDYGNCKASTTSNCTLDNPQLKSKNGIWPEGWGTGQATPIDGGGVHLLQGGSLIQDPVAIRPDIGYTLSVLARVTTPIESFYPLTLKVGQATTTRMVTEGDYQLLTWQLTAREVTETDIGVINQVTTFNSEFPVEVDIKYVCFSPDTASVAPGSCYFGNHAFDADGQGWTPFGNVSFSSGQAFMGDSSLLEQGVLLMPNTDSSPATYHLKALVRLNASAAYTGQIGKSVELKYAFPVESGYTSLGVIDSTLVEAEGRNSYDGNVNIEHVYQLTDDIEISTNTDGLFSFGVLVTDTDGYIKGLRIDSLCLTPDTPDGSFPGQVDGGGFSPPFIERCGVVPTPVDNNVSSWTYYHWKNLERFFTCTLMVKLNQMYSVINDAWKTTRLFWRWCVALVNRSGDWFTTFVWWLNGSFRNIAFGNVTSVYQTEDSSCHDLFCFLGQVVTNVINPLVTKLWQVIDLLLNLITQAANLLFTVVTGIIQLVLSLLTTLLGFLGLAQSLIGSLISAYNNATPIPIPGMPSCQTDPRSGPFCVAIWMLDNTVFSGRGVVIIPITVAIGYIHLLLWVVAELRSAVVNVGTTT